MKQLLHFSQTINSRLFIFVCAFALLYTNTYSQISFADYEKAVNLNRSALMDLNNGNYSLAVKKSIKALSIDSLNRNSYLNLNAACSKTGQNILLIEYLKIAKRIFLEDDEILYYTANAYKEMSQIDSAVENYSLAIKYSKINGEDYPLVYAYYLNRGICYNLQKKYDLALSDLIYSEKLNNKVNAIYANRGFTLFQLERMDEACKDWNRAFELGEFSVQNYINKFCN